MSLPCPIIKHLLVESFWRMPRSRRSASSSSHKFQACDPIAYHLDINGISRIFKSWHFPYKLYKRWERSTLPVPGFCLPNPHHSISLCDLSWLKSRSANAKADVAAAWGPTWEKPASSDTRNKNMDLPPKIGRVHRTSMVNRYWFMLDYVGMFNLGSSQAFRLHLTYLTSGSGISRNDREHKRQSLQGQCCGGSSSWFIPNHAVGICTKFFPRPQHQSKQNSSYLQNSTDHWL